MSSEEGLVAAEAPLRIGDYRFYTPLSVRRHHQILLQRQKMIQRRLVLQQVHQQRQQLLLQQIQLQKMATVKQESSSEAVAAAEKRIDTHVSSIAAALAVPRTVAPVSALKITNLDRLMESVTPSIQARYLSEMNAGNSGMQEANSHPFFYLEDLWESFREWSVYGAAVPLLVNGRDPIEQYYAPSLSGIQLYIDPSKHSSCHGFRGVNWESGSESSGLTNVMDSSSSKGDEKAKSFLNLNIQQLNRLSLGDQSVISLSCSAAAIANSPGSPLFQFLEHEQPYNRRPLSDKMSILASEYPELRNCRSCDLLPTSWICVAWYPIYRIPTGTTLQDLEASFLTFHSLSTQCDCPAQLHARSGKIISGGTVDSAAKILLPVFALASYKLKGSIVSPCEPLECEQANSLLQAADNWLRCLEVILPDYQFFRSHYSQRR